MNLKNQCESISLFKKNQNQRDIQVTNNKLFECSHNVIYKENSNLSWNYEFKYNLNMEKPNLKLFYIAHFKQSSLNLGLNLNLNLSFNEDINSKSNYIFLPSSFLQNIFSFSVFSNNQKENTTQIYQIPISKDKLKLFTNFGSDIVIYIFHDAIELNIYTLFLNCSTETFINPKYELDRKSVV